MKIRHQLCSLLLTNTIFAITLTGLALLWVDRGIEWIAIAWAISNTCAAIVSFTAIYIYRGRPTPEAA